MNFSKQLKSYRELKGYSQEVLAEKIYVTRQTISKWENDKTYPDIHNLIALSILFDISLDELVKGDLLTMKNMIANEKMNQDTKGMLLFLFLILVVGVPSIVIFGLKGFILFGILWAFTMYFAIKIEITKKKYNIKTFKEIVAFSEGASNLEKLQNERDNKKYIKEKMKIIIIFTSIFGILALIIGFLTVLFLKL